MRKLFYATCNANRTVRRIAPLVDLLFRIWIANIFFKAGLTKIASWSSTLYLFESEYAVPLIAPEIAAYLATATELTLPILLVIGLGTRFAAIVLFVFNVVAVISYPSLGEVGRELHIYWGLMLLALIAHGGGLLSVDAWLARRCRPQPTKNLPPAM